VIDGVLRKWFLELSTLNAFVVKVFFIIYPCFWFFKQKNFRVNEVFLCAMGCVFVIFVWAIFSAFFNGNSLEGLLFFLFQIVVVIMAYVVISYRLYLQDFGKILLLLFLFNALISLVQVYSPADSFINSTPGDSEYKAFLSGESSVFGEFIRVYGLFSYIQPNSYFLMYGATVFLILAMSSLGKKYQLIFYFGFFISTFAMFSTGSRYVLYVLVLVTCYCLIYFRSRNVGVLLLVLPLVIVFVVGVDFSLINAFMSRAVEANELEGNSRIAALLLMPFNSTLDSGVIGSGPGSSVVSVSGEFYNEIKYDRIAWELGSIVYVLFFFNRIFLLYLCLKALVRGVNFSRRFPFYPLVFSSCLSVTVYPVHYPVELTFFWFSMFYVFNEMKQKIIK
jgi:hypothetical protein